MQLNTWGHRTIFSYTGSVQIGTEIQYGRRANSTEASAFMIRISAEQYRALLAAFAGARVTVGPSREPRPHTLEHWLQQNVAPTATACYVAQILIHEGYADRIPGNDTDIQFA